MGLAPTRPARARELWLGLIGPIVVIALAYGLTVFADAAVWIGPFDRATFGWLVPMPIWSISPVVGAYLWRGLPTRQAIAIAAAVGVILAGAATWFLYGAWTSADCAFGLNRSNAEFLAEIVPVGLVLGGGWALVAFQSQRRFAAGHRRLAMALGFFGGFALIFLTIAAGVVTNLYLPVCNRPPA